MQLQRFEIQDRFEIPGGGFDARAVDPATGKEVRLWVGAPLMPHAPDPLASLVELKGRLARIYHASLPRVLDAEILEDRPVLKVQPYRGRPLAAETPAERRPAPAALDLARSIGAGLVKAHAAGVTHGGVSEDEIFLTEDGRPLLLHLGFAPFLDRRLPRAPEDLEAPGSETADVFGLSRVLARLLLGEDPFASVSAAAAAGEDPARIAALFAQAGGRTADEFPPELPEGLRRFLARALRADLTGRIHRAEELSGDLGVIRASWGSLAAPPAPRTLPFPGRFGLRSVVLVLGGVLLAVLLVGKGCSGGA